VASEDACVLAGFLAGSPCRPSLDAQLLPATVMTVSECLTDFLPSDQDPVTAPWHPDLASAQAAAQESGLEGVHVLAAHLPAVDRDSVLTLFQPWLPFHPVPRNLIAMAAPAGEPRGFEVVGFEDGRLHSWLCYGLHDQAATELGIRPGPVGLLASLDEARAVAAMANDDRDTPTGTPLDVTWFTVRIAEC
jgi:hypothetical protein